MTLEAQLLQIARQAKTAAYKVAALSSEEKNRCLLAMAALLKEKIPQIIETNAIDLEDAKCLGLSNAMLDRLLLNEKRITEMANGLEVVASLPDPVGRILDTRIRPNGLMLQKISVPIGVILIIYESRPNVTVDAAALCFKAGNATILRGGKESLRTNQLLVSILIEAGKQAISNFPEHAIQLVPTTDKTAIPILLSFTDYIDLCIPRGGEGLIRTVIENARIPVIKHYKGVCMLYVDKDADHNKAIRIAVNAKCQRPGVCNAIETLLIDKAIAKELLPKIAQALWNYNVELRVDQQAFEILKPLSYPDSKLVMASTDDWTKEYLDLILNIKIVEGIEQAISHINSYGSHHSDAIVTENEHTARKFLAEVDSAAVYWNASTRFTDGGEFGMGAEIGISTDKIGARGPMGLDELTTYKWIGIGTGQTRGDIP